MQNHRCIGQKRSQRAKPSQSSQTSAAVAGTWHSCAGTATRGHCTPEQWDPAEQHALPNDPGT
eukprot:9182275-Lingulodinium_polyedra.AAC.1